MARILSLPSEITSDILCRLPADTVVQCRRVCKPWRNLIGLPYFAHMHLRRLLQTDGNGSSASNLSCDHTANSAAVGLLFCLVFPRGNQVYYGEYQTYCDYKLKKINQPIIQNKSVVGSCNGLICFSETNNYDVHEPSYISNPITGEYVKIPTLNDKKDSQLEAMVCGFGYHPATENYKIVKICYIKNQSLGQVKVYTLGSGGNWRNAGETHYSLVPTKCPLHWNIGETAILFRPSSGWLGKPNTSYTSQGISSYRSPFGTLANGALHWLNKDNEIVSFDLASENMYLLPSPPFPRTTSEGYCFRLQVLCFVQESYQRGLDIFFLRKEGRSCSFDVNEQVDFDSLRWIKEFSIPIGREALPCALTGSGEVLLHDVSSLFCYNSQTAEVERLSIEEICQVVPHVNTFVSLKDLEEKCLLRKRYHADKAPKEIFIKVQMEMIMK